MRLARSLSARLIATLAMVTALLGVPASGAAAQGAYYVAPDGSDSAAGTQAAPWRSIAHAQSVAQAGDTVYFRGGTYAYTNAARNCSSQTDRVSAIVLNKSGSSGDPITYSAYPGETPVFDFSGMWNDCRIKGFEVTANWIHLKGLEITGVPQNNDQNAESWGVWVSGSRNTFEQLDIHHIMGTGLFINGGGGNLVLNSDSHENYDPRSTDGPGENADGFGSHYVPAGSPENVFRGSRAWWNGDDGYDLISTYSPVTIENSWAWLNGYEPGTTNSAGNGAGFKIGGFGADWEDGAPKHTVTGSVAFENKAQGFYANYHPVASDFFNNTAYDNHPNFSMRGIDQGGNTSVGRGTLRNNIAYTGTATDYMNGTDSAYNSWDLGVGLSDADFQSVSTSGWDAPRQADGSLPELPHLRLAEDSDLIDAGTDVGLPYEGAAPDLGAFESGDSGDAVRYEAEDAPATCDGTIESNHSGYSGSGFCDTPNTAGTAAQFTVNAESAGEATVRVRFANGSSDGARGADVVVNGATVTSTSFENTGTWNTWSTKTVTVPLNAGDNTIRLVATGSGGLPNIDLLDLVLPDGGGDPVRYEAEDPPATFACAVAMRRNPAGSISSSARQAVAGEATTPNTSGWWRSVSMSQIASPAAIITARSVSTLPRSWAGHQPRRASASDSCPVSPVRSASIRSSAAPACDTTPVPSAVTRNPFDHAVDCTSKVPLPLRELLMSQSTVSLTGEALSLIYTPPNGHTR
jgi:hypothetical protein